MKKILKGALAGALMLSMVACSSSDSSKNGETNETITIGASITSTGPFAAVGVPYGNLYKAYVDYINANPELYDNSMNGRTLEYIIYDDGGDPNQGKTFIERLIEDDQVDALVGILGTWNVVAAKDILEESGVPSVYFGTGSSEQMFEPATGDQRYMMGVQPLYKTEGRLMYLRALTQFEGVQTIGVIHSDADDGLSLRAGIEEQMAMDTRVNKPNVIFQQIPSSATKSDITAQVNAISGADVIIAAANQAPFQAIYKAIQENGTTKGAPIITTYVNISPTNMPEEAVTAENSEVFGAAWVVFNEEPGSSPEADRRLADYAEYLAVIDADTKYIPADQKETYKLNAYAMSSFIAIKAFLVGMERLNTQGLEFTPENYLTVMEEERVPIAISGGVDYKDGYRIGLDSLSFVKFVPVAGQPAAAGQFEQVDPMTSIDDLVNELK